MWPKLPHPLLAPGGRHPGEVIWLYGQVPSYFCGQKQSIPLLVATELLLHLSLGHSQACKLSAANLNFVIRPPMVVFLVVSIFNSMLATVCLSGRSHSSQCMLWLFRGHHVYGVIYCCHFLHFALDARAGSLVYFRLPSYTNKLNICSLYAQESIKITNKLWQLFHHLLLSSTNWAVETTSVSRSVSGWSPICHQKRSNNETSYSLSFLQEFPPLEIFSLKFKFKESMYIQICLLFTNLSNQAHSTKSIP